MGEVCAVQGAWGHRARIQRLEKPDPKGERGCLNDQCPSITLLPATFPDLCQERELRGKQEHNAHIVSTESHQTSQQVR